ncbi:MMPL family transporter [Tessaracoccus sp. MC1865]|uniref:MMPL family transporter n=1 Tax=Tessaracoccus sp. MC1865 TaxID=2760310 RepID=UPI0015FFD1DC|nr:MMPL family transporter [Tessaracoccus sp. MC1865]MBB1482980.1 MMPL family transporter [Tessaracoccus sp. MC1865]QTO37583.1 MMPL family transporter [Tessaracoccus sp. MC1865]
MSAWLYAVGKWCFRRRLTVLAIWLAVLLGLGGAAAAWSGSFNNDFEIPSSNSQEALEKLRMTFPQGAALSAMAVIVLPEGESVETYRPQIEDAVASFAALDEVEADGATSPWNEFVDGLVSDDERAALIQLSLGFSGVTPTADDLAPITEVADALQTELPPGSEVAMGGEAYNIELPALSLIEIIGLVVALIVLTVVLGSLVAAGLPLLTAIMGVGITTALMFLLTSVFAINSTTPILSVMLGLAVGIDYALFILSRHRDQLRQGLEPQESAGRAVGTSGSAVVFAGLTVFIALLGLSVANIPFLTVMGIFAALGVALAVAVALTLLPALMGFMGEKMRPRERAPKARKKSRSGTGAFAWWVGVTTKHPVATIISVVVLLGALTIPTVGLQVSLPNAGQQRAEQPARIAYDLMAEHFGEGVNGPLVVTADIIGSTDPLGVMADLKADIERMDGVASVPLSTPNPNADTGLIQVVPTTGPDDPATAVLARALMDRHDEWLAEYDVNTNLTGMTAVQIDISDKLTQALLPFGLLVVGLSLVLLAAVFRSVWVPVKATVGYLLSVGAAFGATTLVFNHGWLKELVNLERGMPVISFLPILLMGILFGLAMDYEVFLVSRIREEYVHGKSALDAIRSGFVASGPVVAAAAVIMFAVFAFFVPEGMGPIKSIAFALAVGVAVDAFLVRMTLVPAVMTLLGDRAWWLPAWLDRLLPTFDVEGEVLSKEMALKEWPGDGSALHAEDLEVEGIVEPLTLWLMPGQVAGVVGPVGARTGALLALGGRLQTTGGRARVAGALLPEGAGRARRRVTYLDLARVDDVASALESTRPATVVIVDSVDVVTPGAARDALDQLIQNTRSRGAVLLGAASAEHLIDLTPDGVLNVATPLHEETRA